MKPLMPFRIFNKAKTALPVEDQHWYRIKAETQAEQTTIEIYIYGEIGASWWDDEGTSAQSFADELKAITASEITIHLKGKDLFAEAHNADLYHAMDAVVDKLERQVVKHKEKIQDHHHEKHFE